MLHSRLPLFLSFLVVEVVMQRHRGQARDLLPQRVLVSSDLVRRASGDDNLLP